MDSGEPEGGVDFEIDEFSHRFLIGEPLPERGQGNMMHDDILTRNSATGGFPDEVLRMKQAGDFRCHAG